jgi:hypothetical protein
MSVLLRISMLSWQSTLRAACAGTTKKGGRCTMPAAKGSNYCYLHDPDPAVAERRWRNASRAATLGNSKIGAEIRSTHLLVRDFMETVISNELHPLVRKRLSEVVGLLQVYSRLAELEMAVGDMPRFPGKGYVALPEDTEQRARQWGEGEAEREAAMKKISAFAKDPRTVL